MIFFGIKPISRKISRSSLSTILTDKKKLTKEPISKRSKPSLKKRPDVELIATISL
jgi:hypothetical protein